MLVTGDLSKVTVRQAALSDVLGVSRQRISQLVKDGVIVREPGNPSGAVLLVESLKNVYQSRAEHANASSDININDERAKFERARRVLEELKVAKAMRKVYDARTVELVMTEELSTLRTQLLGLPSKLAPMLEGKTREEINSIMTREIEGKLMELSEYSPGLFDEEVEDDESATEDGE